MQVLESYFMALVLFQPIEELYTCNHPNTIDNNQQLLCNWTDQDFRVNKYGDRVLKKQNNNDNFIKAYYRKKYWSNNVKDR